MKKKELQSIDYIKERADENLAKTKIRIRQWNR